jgi:hypothetical protein
MRKLFGDTGYEIRQIAENRSYQWKFRLLNALSLGLMKPFSVYQYLFVLKKQFGHRTPPKRTELG